VRLRSLLFAPANRPDLVEKFPRYPADLFVIDLEDGTPEPERDAARRALPALVAHLRRGGFERRLLVRVNQPRSPRFEPDVAAAASCAADGVMIPKLESEDDLRRAGALLEAAPGAPRGVIGLVETAAGIVNVEALARAGPPLWALAFGAEDLVTELGGRRTAEGVEVLYARSRLVLAAKAARIGALDQVVVDIRDAERFRRDAAFGRQLGYDGKMCLLPRQVELANEIFSPAPDEIERSRRLLAAFEEGRRAGRGVIEFEGTMIDEPLVRRARAILELASEDAPGGA